MKKHPTELSDVEFVRRFSIVEVWDVMRVIFRDDSFCMSSAFVISLFSIGSSTRRSSGSNNFDN